MSSTIWKKLERLSVTIGIFSGALTTYTFIKELDGTKISKEDYDKLVEGNFFLKKKLDESLAEILKSNELNKDLQTQHQQILESLRESQTKWAEWQSQLDKLGINTSQKGSILELFKKNNPNIDWSKDPQYQKLSDYFDNYKESLNNLNYTNNFIDYIKELIINYQEWLHSLPLIKQLAIAHAIIGVTTLISIISLLITYFSNNLLDWLTKRYDIETKYPKIFKFLNLRRKLQNYYLLFTFSMIVLLLAFVLYADFKVIIN